MRYLNNETILFPRLQLTPALQKKLDSSKKTSGQLPVVQVIETDIFLIFCGLLPACIFIQPASTCCTGRGTSARNGNCEAQRWV